MFVLTRLLFYQGIASTVFLDGDLHIDMTQSNNNSTGEEYNVLQYFVVCISFVLVYVTCMVDYTNLIRRLFRH